MKRPGTVDVEILRNRAALKTWVVKRIALSPVALGEEEDASHWFHELPVDDRKQLIYDLARAGVDGADLRVIAMGPLGDLVRRHPSLFRSNEALVGDSAVEDTSIEHATEEMPVPSLAMIGLDEAELNWSSDWESFERQLDDANWVAK